MHLPRKSNYNIVMLGSDAPPVSFMDSLERLIGRNKDHSDRAISLLRSVLDSRSLDAIVPGWRSWEALARSLAALQSAAALKNYELQGVAVSKWDGHLAHTGRYFTIPGFDHGYKLTFPDGNIEFVSEPYALDLLDNFDWATDPMWRIIIKHWDVTIGGRMALHYPGSTFPVVFRKRKTPRSIRRVPRSVRVYLPR
jgi:hypothetical protein